MYVNDAVLSGFGRNIKDILDYQVDRPSKSDFFFSGFWTTILIFILRIPSWPTKEVGIQVFLFL